jgi:hypothetical protein
MWVVLRFGRQGLKAKSGDCKTEVGRKGKKREKKGRRESAS